MNLCPNCHHNTLRDGGMCTRCFYLPKPVRDYAEEEPASRADERAFWTILITWVVGLTGLIIWLLVSC